MPQWGMDNYRPFDFVYMYQDDTCEIICQADLPFNSFDQKSKCSIYVYHWMRLIWLCVKILAASDMDTRMNRKVTCVKANPLLFISILFRFRSHANNPKTLALCAIQLQRESRKAIQYRSAP